MTRAEGETFGEPVGSRKPYDPTADNNDLVTVHELLQFSPQPLGAHGNPRLDAVLDFTKSWRYMRLLGLVLPVMLAAGCAARVRRT